MKHDVTVIIDWELREFTLKIDGEELATLALKPEIPDTLEGFEDGFPQEVPKPDCDCESCESENLYDDKREVEDLLETIEEMRYNQFKQHLARYREEALQRKYGRRKFYEPPF